MSASKKLRTVGLALLLVAAGIADAAPGDLDPAFGIAGRVFIDIENQFEAATSIVQQRDGKLLIGRWVYYWPSAEDFSVMRLQADGMLDSSFSGDGRAFVTLPGSLRGITRAVLELADGKIIAVGRVTDENGLGVIYGLVRYTATGAADSTFGTGGVVSGNFGATQAAIDAVVEQADGRLVVAGGVSATASASDTVLARFNADGSLDPSFGAAGILRVDFSRAGKDDIARALVLQGDGKLVAAGYAVAASGASKLALLRVTPDGSLDPTFGQGGLAEVDLPGASPSSKLGLQLQSDGMLVVGGQSMNDAAGDCSAVVARIGTDGNPDPTFNGSGVVRWSLGSCAFAGAASIVAEPGGAIVFGSVGTQIADARVTRLTSNGEVDDAFGVNGSAIVDLASGSAASYADPDVGINLALQADGRIVLTASDQFDWDYGGSYFTVARLLESGSSAGLIGFASTYAIAPEGGSASFIVRRTGGAAGAASVDFSTENGNADAADFTAASGTLTWADGDASIRTITIPITDDSLAESTEYFTLTLANPAGGAHFAADQAYVYIEDNDSSPPPPPSPPPVSSSGGGGGAVDWMSLLVLALVLIRHGVRSD